MTLPLFGQGLGAHVKNTPRSVSRVVHWHDPEVSFLSHIRELAFVGDEESEDDAEKFIRETQDRGGILACKIDASFLARRAFDWRRVRSRLAIWSQIYDVR